MKKMIALVLVLCFLLAGCGSATNKSETEVNPQEQVSVEQTPAVDAEQETEEESVPAESAEPAVTIYPLPDDTMENLTDAMVAISLAEGGAYLDDDGKLQRDVTI